MKTGSYMQNVYPFSKFHRFMPEKLPLFLDFANSCLTLKNYPFLPLQWRHNERDCVSNHQPHDCFSLLNRLFRHSSKKTSKLRVTGLCAGNSPGTGEFPAQMASNAEKVSIWWRHHVRESGYERGIRFDREWGSQGCGSVHLGPVNSRLDP